MAISLSSAMKALAATAYATAVNGGVMRIKDGSGNVLVTTGALTWTPSGSTLVSSDPAAVAITASGTATTFEILNSSNVVCATGTVGASGADLTVSTTTFVSGVNFDESAYTITVN